MSGLRPEAVVLTSETAFCRFRRLIDATGHRVGYVRHAPDGAVLCDDDLVDATRVDVAWLTPDILYDGSRSSFFSLVERASSLRWVQSSFAGLDLPLYRHLLERRCQLTTSHENALSIAEFVLGSVLRIFQQPERWSAAQSEHAWRHHEFREIFGTKWLILGFGAIGQATAVRARAFGAHVTAVRRHLSGDEPADRMIQPREVGTFLRESDVIVLALPGSPETEGIVNEEFLAAMKPRGILVNVARGSLIDDAALLRTLTHRDDLDYVLDVFRVEPLPADSPLWTHPNVTVTPHASSGGLGRHERNAELFARNLRALLSGMPLEHEVTLDDLPPATRDSVPAQFH